MIPNQELQHFITEWNFLHSPGSFNDIVRDNQKGRYEGDEVERLTPLQAFEAGRNK